jgi:hypothetical protein
LDVSSHNVVRVLDKEECTLCSSHWFFYKNYRSMYLHSTLLSRALAA